MPRATKSRSRKASASTARVRALNAVDRTLVRRYLAFIRAVVGVSTKTAAR